MRHASENSLRLRDVYNVVWTCRGRSRNLEEWRYSSLTRIMNLNCEVQVRSWHMHLPTYLYHADSVG